MSWRPEYPLSCYVQSLQSLSFAMSVTGRQASFRAAPKQISWQGHVQSLTYGNMVQYPQSGSLAHGRFLVYARVCKLSRSGSGIAVPSVTRLMSRVWFSTSCAVAATRGGGHANSCQLMPHGTGGRSCPVTDNLLDAHVQSTWSRKGYALKR